MAAYEVLLLNTAVPQIQAAQAGDTYVVPRDIAINATAIISANSATDALRITQTGAGNAILVEDSANPDSTPFVVTATGAVGIGTPTPSQLLSVAAATALVDITSTTGTNFNGVELKNTSGSFYIGQDNSAGSFYGSNSAYARSLYATGAYPMVFFTNGAEKMRLDSSGNLGLGVTPNANWGTSAGIYRVMQVGTTAAFGGNQSFNRAYMFSNVYWDGSNYKYLITGPSPASWYEQSDGAHYWFRAASGSGGATISQIQAMTLDALGRLGIGETSPVTDIDILRASGDVSTRFRNGTATGIVGVRSDNNFTELRAVSNHGIQFSTANTEKARITAGGYFKASNTGNYSNAGLFHEFYQTENYTGLLVRATNGSFAESVLTVNGDRATTNSSYSLIDAYNGDLTGRFIVRDSGNAVNTNGSYGTISDQKLKQDIIDAGSQWDDLKAIRFRKYRMKADVAANPNAPALLGVVAQELEQTSPGLVETTADRDQEGNDLGTTTKTVKSSILLMKAAVALQEAMARIEQLEAKVASLGA